MFRAARAGRARNWSVSNSGVRRGKSQDEYGDARPAELAEASGRSSFTITAAVADVKCNRGSASRGMVTAGDEEVPVSFRADHHGVR